MKFAAYTDNLVLGIGDDPDKAIANAVAHGADADLLDTCEITDRAAAYVSAGGDCRALRFSDNDPPVISINPTYSLPPTRLT